MKIENLKINKNLEETANKLKLKENRAIGYASALYLLTIGSGIASGVCAIVAPKNLEEALACTGGFALVGTISFVHSVITGIRADKAEEQAKQYKKGK